MAFTVSSEYTSVCISTESTWNNLQALQYARAASVVRACAYEITGNVVERSLPFVAANARIINEIAKTGTCAELDAFRYVTP